MTQEIQPSPYWAGDRHAWRYVCWYCGAWFLAADEFGTHLHDEHGRSTMNDQLAQNLKQSAHDFRKNFSAKLGEKKTDEIVEKMLAADTAYAADGAIVSGVFWVEVRVNNWDGQDLQYTGEGGGVFTPGGGALIGAVYTDDLAGLLANTTRFEVNAAAAYTSIVFFDDDSNCLGSYQSGSVSTVIGIGGGKGTWGSA